MFLHEQTKQLTIHTSGTVAIQLMGGRIDAIRSIRDTSVCTPTVQLCVHIYVSGARASRLCSRSDWAPGEVFSSSPDS